MDILLSPEKNNRLLKYYHTSSKALIPLILGSCITEYYNEKNTKNIFHVSNILNIGYHSYISTSCIITDYIKPNYLSRGSRGLSLGFHGLAIYGYMQNLYKN